MRTNTDSPVSLAKKEEEEKTHVGQGLPGTNQPTNQHHHSPSPNRTEPIPSLPNPTPSSPSHRGNKSHPSLNISGFPEEEKPPSSFPHGPKIPSFSAPPPPTNGLFSPRRGSPGLLGEGMFVFIIIRLCGIECLSGLHWTLDEGGFGWTVRGGIAICVLGVCNV